MMMTTYHEAHVQAQQFGWNIDLRLEQGRYALEDGHGSNEIFTYIFGKTGKETYQELHNHRHTLDLAFLELIDSGRAPWNEYNELCANLNALELELKEQEYHLT